MSDETFYVSTARSYGKSQHYQVLKNTFSRIREKVEYIKPYAVRDVKATKEFWDNMIKMSEPEPELPMIQDEETLDVRITVPMTDVVVENDGFDGAVTGVTVKIPFDPLRKLVLEYLRKQEIQKLQNYTTDEFEEYITGMWPYS